jgi:hypothetical protein
LKNYDDIQGIDWKWQSFDSSVSIKAPLGGGQDRSTSTRQRRARYQKTHILPDKNSIQLLAAVITAANIHDVVVAIKTLDSIVIKRPNNKKKKQNLCLDRGYYSTAEIGHEIVKRR